MADPAYQKYNGAPLAPTPPNLPVAAPATYDTTFENQMLNVLRLYFNQLNNYTQAIATPEFGVTADRPTTGLQTGQIFFDTTLDIPIWWNGTKWVNASGTGV
jgi:hypothetical protein